MLRAGLGSQVTQMLVHGQSQVGDIKTLQKFGCYTRPELYFLLASPVHNEFRNC